MSVKDKDGQVLLADYLRAYAGTPILTEGRLPGGGKLFAECARATERTPDPEQLPLGEQGDR